MSDEKDIKKFLEEKKVIIGRDESLKALRTANLEIIYLAKNAPKELVEDIEHYSNINKTKVVKLEITNEDLGVLCKKPFFISVLGVKK